MVAWSCEAEAVEALGRGRKDKERERNTKRGIQREGYTNTVKHKYSETQIQSAQL